MDITFNLLLIVIWQATNAINQNFVVVKPPYDIENVLQTSRYDHIGHYELLLVSNKCIISQCHGSTQDTLNYYRYCFKSECPYQHYHCLNGVENIIHFCVKFDDCKPRSKDIAVFNEQTPGFVDVYNVACKPGYFQPNERHNCFQPCALDTSIAIVQTSGHNPQAFCLPEHGCNPFGKLFFELGTKYDDCTGRNQCSTSQDLLPDCSCIELCPPNHVRLPGNVFRCSSREKVVSPSTSYTKESVAPTLTIPGDEKRDTDNAHEPKDDQPEDKSGSNDIVLSTIAIVIPCVCVMVIIGVAGRLYFKLSGVNTHTRTNFSTRNELNNIFNLDNINDLTINVENGKQFKPLLSNSSSSDSSAVRDDAIRHEKCNTDPTMEDLKDEDPVKVPTEGGRGNGDGQSLYDSQTYIKQTQV